MPVILGQTKSAEAELLGMELAPGTALHVGVALRTGRSVSDQTADRKPNDQAHAKAGRDENQLNHLQPSVFAVAIFAGPICRSTNVLFPPTMCFNASLRASSQEAAPRVGVRGWSTATLMRFTMFRNLRAAWRTFPQCSRQRA